jgi:aminoglycoside phosphotransferase
MSRSADLLDLTESVLVAAGFDAPRGEVSVVPHGKSGDLVALVSGPPAVVVKLAPADLPSHCRALEREIAVLRWLAPLARVPRVIWTGKLRAGTALVMEGLPGVAASHVAREDAEAAMIACVRALAALHSHEVVGCPFDARLDTRLQWGEANVVAGLVDESDFDDERVGWSAAAALVAVRRDRPASEDLVLTHGDACLPNFIWSGGGEVAMVDLARFGVADRHQDLALFLRSAQNNHPHVDAAALIEAHYPVAADADRCAFYRLLDELF